MIYSIFYHTFEEAKLLQDAQEIRFLFNRKDTTLPDFLETYGNKNLLMTIENPEPADLKLILALYEKYHNFKCACAYHDDFVWTALRDNGIPFFFTDHVDNWDILQGFISLGVTEMYICNDMCFEIRAVEDILHSYGIKIRVYPNVAQSRFGGNNGVYSFFIRPDDIDLYEGMIDVVEFFCPSDKYTNQSVLLEIYKTKKTWFGPLKEIIQNLDSDIDGSRMTTIFGDRRLICNHKCMRGRECDICGAIEQMSAVLTDKNYVMNDDQLSYFDKNEKI